jgi:uncharacterized protein YjbI with pentapeptide repeats
MLLPLLLLASLASTTAAATTPQGPDPAAVASIRAGHHDCPHCRLSHADLTNQCVKHGNLKGADFDDARMVLMCMSWGDYTGASFRGADLSGANLAHANLGDADLTGARLTIASIRAADLSTTKGLTQRQVDEACGDSKTRLPPNLHVNICS